MALRRAAGRCAVPLANPVSQPRSAKTAASLSPHRNSEPQRADGAIPGRTRLRAGGRFAALLRTAVFARSSPPKGSSLNGSGRQGSKRLQGPSFRVLRGSGNRPDTGLGTVQTHAGACWTRLGLPLHPRVHVVRLHPLLLHGNARQELEHHPAAEASRLLATVVVEGVVLDEIEPHDPLRRRELP